MEIMKFLSPTASILSIVYYGLSIVQILFGDPQNQQAQQELEEVDSQLSDIDQQLTTMNNELGQIQHSINVLSAQLNIDTQKIEAYIQEVGIEDAIAIIQSHFANIPITGLQWYLTTQETDGVGIPAATTDDISQFATNVFGAWDIGAQINLISNAILGRNIGTNAGLLESWSNLLISEMGTTGNNPNLYNYYLVFEGYYLQQLTTQVAGMQILMNSYCYQQQDGQCSEGQSYYNETFAPMIQEQLALYIQFVERMVISQFSLAAPNGVISFPEDGLKVLTRADLLVGAVLQNFANPPQTGLVGRYLGTAAAISSGHGPTLQPSYQPYGEMTASAGQAVVPSTGYPTPYWANTEEPYVSLQSYSDSDIYIIRYYWPWPEPAPAAGTTITIGPGITATPQYYDLETREITNEPSDSTVLFAEFVDFSSLVTQVTGIGGWSASGVSMTVNNSYVSTTHSGPTAASDGAVTGKFYASDPSGFGTSASTYTFSLIRNFTYLGTDDAEINVEINATLSLEGTTEVNDYSGQKLLFQPKLTISCDADSTFAYDSAAAGISLPASTQERQGSVSLTNQPVIFNAPLTLKASQNFNISFNLIINCSAQGEYSAAIDQSATATVTINSIGFYYSLPPVTPT